MEKTQNDQYGFSKILNTCVNRYITMSSQKSNRKTAPGRRKSKEIYIDRTNRSTRVVKGILKSSDKSLSVHPGTSRTCLCVLLAYFVLVEFNNPLWQKVG